MEVSVEPPLGGRHWNVLLFFKGDLLQVSLGCFAPFPTALVE